MNCQEFENIIIDLARHQMMDAALREKGLAHSKTCARCARRLADEQALTAGLRALAASSEQQSAPPRIEAALRAAFREPHKHVAVNEHAMAAAAMAFIPPATSAPHWRRWALAAAAAILVALALLAQSWLRAASPNDLRQVKDKTPSVSLPPPVKVELPPSRMAVLPEQRPGLVHSERYSPGLVPASNIKHSNRTPRNVAQQAVEREIVTDFFPLTYDSDLEQEGGHVVRVRMPRSALVTFGLPMNFERASETVQADVLMGHDGLARAIRFVH